MGNQRRDRLQLTVSTPMRLALTVLAEKSGLQLSTQATMLLRQALHQTMQSAEVQRRLGEHNRSRTLATWQTDRTTEHAVETEYAKQAKQAAPKRETTVSGE